MTLTKESLREALARSRQLSASKGFVIAARFVERLLPAECVCVTSEYRSDIENHLACHGTGQLWDEGLVEVVAHLLYDTFFVDGGTLPFYQDRARAVLSALTAEVGK